MTELQAKEIIRQARILNSLLVKISARLDINNGVEYDSAARDAENWNRVIGYVDAEDTEN